jgi:hypothetical protein
MRDAAGVVPGRRVWGRHLIGVAALSVAVAGCATAPGRGARSPPVIPGRNGGRCWPGRGGRRSPIPGGPPVGYAEIVTRTVRLLADPPQSWSTLARELQALYQASTPAARTTSPTAAAGAAAAAYDNAYESLVAVTCADTTNPRDPFRWPPVARQRDRRSARSAPSGPTCPSRAPPGPRATTTATAARSAAAPLPPS